MGVIVDKLNKFYGKHHILKNISFTINKGDILGFLGPNGAGKTTTMKIITTLLQPSSGKVLINGVDTGSKDAYDITRHIGYLPENNPLYIDLYVIESLSFIAKIRKKNITNAAIKDILARTGLLEVKNKKAKTLSKGYKQRLGIAQAIVHDPEILILDEPSSGLDPIQIIEIRKLIKDIASDKAVLISTHIMQEVEAMCNKILVINKGKIVANEAINAATKYNKRLFKVEFNEKIDIEALYKFIQLQNNDSIKLIDDKVILIQSEKDPRSLLTEFASKNNYFILHLSIENRSIENIFKNISK